MLLAVHKLNLFITIKNFLTFLAIILTTKFNFLFIYRFYLLIVDFICLYILNLNIHLIILIIHLLKFLFFINI